MYLWEEEWGTPASAASFIAHAKSSRSEDNGTFHEVKVTHQNTYKLFIAKRIKL
jgi:hypothetical protein